MIDTSALPGGDLVDRGVTDLAAGRETVESLLVAIAAPRLRALGLEIRHDWSNPEHRLYERLARDLGDGAHARYNSLIQRIVSFELAAECVS